MVGCVCQNATKSPIPHAFLKYTLAAPCLRVESNSSSLMWEIECLPKYIHTPILGSCEYVVTGLCNVGKV